MKSPVAAIHVAKIVRKHHGRTYVSYLLRRSYRQDGQVKHRTLGNLSHLPERLIDIIRRSLRGEAFVSSAEAFRTVATKTHGHVEAVLAAFRTLDLENLIASKPSRQRSLVLALIAQRILFPCSKLATTRHWHTTTLAEELAVADADSKELYVAMDWLLRRQAEIENKLAQRHLAEGAVVLRSRHKLYAQKDLHITFEDVAGIDEAVAELREVVDFLKTPEKYHRSRTRAAPTPTNISTKSEPLMPKKGTPASPATALASRVLPVPGGPTKSTPLGIRPPKA